MTEQVEVIETKQIEEVEEDVASISFEVSEGKPQKLDFSNAPKPKNEELAIAVVFLVNRNEDGEKGPLTLKVKYNDVESLEGDINNQPIVPKEDVVAKFGDDDFEQKETQFTFTEEHEAEFFAEGKGSCTVFVHFSLDNDDEEEEEEEEAHEK